MKIFMTRNIKNHLTLAVALVIGLSSLTVYGQQHPSLDNYLFTPVSISPANAGMQQQDVVSLVDAQWVGIKGAPRTGIISADYRSLNGLGLNMTLVTDAVGPATTSYMGLSAAYHLPISEEATLSTGLRVSLGRSTVDFNNEFYFDLVDPNIYSVQGPMMANVDVGTTLNTKSFYAGVSFKNLNRAEIYKNNYTAQVLHVFGGHRMDVTQDWALTSSFLMTGTSNSPADLNMHAYVERSNTWGVGLHYSPADEMGMLFRVKPTDDWHLFYQYNFPLTELVYVTRTSHVVGVAFNVMQKVTSLTSPRYFL